MKSSRTSHWIFAVAVLWLAAAGPAAGGTVPLPPGSDALVSGPMPLKGTDGPRTSPFNPPEENDHSFTTDAAPKLDTGCIFSSLGPIVFDVEVTRHVGVLNGDGTLRDADALVDAGLLSDKATLIMPGFDVDSNATPPAPFKPEQDRVLFNGEEVGFLTGENNVWKLSTFEIDIRKVKFAARAAEGSDPQPARNRVTVEIDVGNFPTQVWCTSVDWGTASFKAMSPILLIHGNNSNGGFFQRRGFTGELDARHLLYDNSITMPTDTVANHGDVLETRIPGIVQSFGVDSVHLVAHSKGGLDSRDYLARYQPTHDQDFKVLSYSTLSTPHNGSILADLLVLRDRAATLATETEFRNFPTFTETVVNQSATDVGTTNLTTAFTATFNAGNLPLVSNQTVFNTVAADADTNGNNQIDRDPDEYADLRAESQGLQDLDNTPVVGQGLSRRGVDLVYQILRTTDRIDLTVERRSRFLRSDITVAVLTRVVRQQPVGNDVLVTIPSGQGQGSVAGRTANTRVFQGAQGRNHSNVADGGVARTVAPWIIEVERRSGDLQ